MKKNHFTAIAGLCALGSVQAKVPNIVYIFTDQQNAFAMSCAGNRDLSTPNMDKLAKEGIRFTNAYCAMPLSTASRAAMMTGLPPGQTDQLKNATAIPDRYVKTSLGWLLKNAGYDCAYGGKWHLPGGNIDDAAFGFARLHGNNDIGLAESCIKFLKQKHDKPFFLVASFVNPHNICEYARKQNLPYARLTEPPLEQCPNLPANFAPNPYDADVIRFEQRADFTKYPVPDYTPDDWRRYRNAYYRLTETVDAEIGKILKALDDAGLSDNTLVIFTSDHGDGNAAHQWNQKSALYEESINIPFIVKLPGKKHAGTVSEQLFNNGIDLLPTLCDFAGASVPVYCKGKSFKPFLEQNSANPVRDHLVVETMFDGSETRGWAVRTQQYKYAVYDKGRYREQLFDLTRDKGEMINLAVQAEYQNVMKQHRELLRKWLRENDMNISPRIIPND